MSRPLHNILRRQQIKMKLTAKTSALLMEFAKADRPANAHRLIATIVQKWITDSAGNEPVK